MPTETLHLLHRLVQCAIDGREDFSQAAEWVVDVDLKQVLTEQAVTYQQLVDELQQAVRELGATPRSEGSVAAAAHRGWARVVGSVMDANNTALEELERGEEGTRRTFAEGLRAPHLPLLARQAIERRSSGLFGGDESVSRLRQRFLRAG